jgi:hypothetical protein
MTLVARIDLTGLERLTKEMEPRAEKVLDDTAFQVETEAKNSAPVLTGALRNSIHVERPGRLHRIISDATDYGIWVELGHRTKAFTKSYGAQRWVQAKPFMVPAVEKVRAKFEKMWEALFK